LSGFCPTTLTLGLHLPLFSVSAPPCLACPFSPCRDIWGPYRLLPAILHPVLSVRALLSLLLSTWPLLGASPSSSHTWNDLVTVPCPPVSTNPYFLHSVF
jgi:hypothetical protein